MRRDPLVVFGNRARVRRIVAGRGRESRHHLAVPEHVVGDQQSTGAEQRDQPIEERLVELLVAVLKNEIERAGHLRDFQPRVADNDAHALGDAGTREILARFPRALLAHLHREQPAARWQRAGQPDAGIADRRADFQDA